MATTLVDVVGDPKVSSLSVVKDERALVLEEKDEVNVALAPGSAPAEPPAALLRLAHPALGPLALPHDEGRQGQPESREEVAEPHDRPAPPGQGGDQPRLLEDLAHRRHDLVGLQQLPGEGERGAGSSSLSWSIGVQMPSGQMHEMCTSLTLAARRSAMVLRLNPMTACFEAA